MVAFVGQNFALLRHAASYNRHKTVKSGSLEPGI